MMYEKLSKWVNIDLQKQTDEELDEILNCGIHLDEAFANLIDDELIRRAEIKRVLDMKEEDVDFFIEKNRKKNHIALSDVPSIKKFFNVISA